MHSQGHQLNLFSNEIIFIAFGVTFVGTLWLFFFNTKQIGNSFVAHLHGNFYQSTWKGPKGLLIVENGLFEQI